MEALTAITLQEFQNCFEQWKKRWDKCIASQGEYFEGDEIVEMFREIYDLKKNARYFWVPHILNSSGERPHPCLTPLFV